MGLVLLVYVICLACVNWPRKEKQQETQRGEIVKPIARRCATSEAVVQRRKAYRQERKRQEFKTWQENNRVLFG